MRKTIILDELGKHPDEEWGIFAHRLTNTFPDSESKLIRTLNEAKAELKRGCVDLAIIHHYSFIETEELRRLSRNTKFAAYSGTFGDMLCSGTQKGIGAWNKFSRAYDFLVTRTGTDVPKILKSVYGEADEK
jgi:hypothetical protein